MHHDPEVTVADLADAPSDYGQTLEAILGAKQDGLDTWAWPEEEPKLGCITFDDDIWTSFKCDTATGQCKTARGGISREKCQASCAPPANEPAERDTWAWPEEKPKLGCITLDDDSITSWGCIVNSQGRKVCSIVSHGTETSTQCRAHCTSASAERDTWAWPEEEPKLGCITLDDDAFVHWACVTGSTGRKSCQYVSGGAPTGTSAECRATCGKSEAENVFTAKTA
jgi:hypothetical protein